MSDDEIGAVAPFELREDLADAHRRVWSNLGRPGTWLTGAERVAVAASTRAARDCALCRERKKALSPYSVDGKHSGASDLDEARVDAVHRIATDPGRLSKRLLDELSASGVDDAAYVELVAVAVFTMSIDMFQRAIGAEPLDLPQAEPGEPSRQRPAQLEDIGAWVPVLAADSPTGRELFGGGARVSNVVRGFSLVPATVREQITLVQAQYMPLPAIASSSEPGRAIHRAQIELVASRVSALNECFY